MKNAIKLLHILHEKFPCDKGTHALMLAPKDAPTEAVLLLQMFVEEKFYYFYLTEKDVTCDPRELAHELEHALKDARRK